MAVNKVIYGETTVIDITDSTVTASKLKSGETAYGADGQKVIGTLVVPEVLDDLSDVVITTPRTAQEIYFDGTNWINYGAKIVLTFDDDFKGQTITLTKGQTTITKTAPLDSNTMNLYVNETGTWTISSEISEITYETEVNVTTFGTSFDAELVIGETVPQGSTVTPTDDIQIWLACANLDKPYTTLEAVLADRETFETLIADSNACDYMARSTTWADDVADDSDAMALIGKYDYCSNALLGNATWASAIANSDYWDSVLQPLVPIMTSATTPSGTASASSSWTNNYPAWHGFTNGATDGWIPNGLTGWIQYEFPTPVKAYVFTEYNHVTTNRPSTVSIEISEDGINFTQIKSGISILGTNGFKAKEALDNTFACKYYRINTTAVSGSGSNYYPWLGSLQFYGRSSNEVLVPLVPIMTSNTTPSGEVLFDNGQTSGGSSANSYYVLFDRAMSQVVGVSGSTQWQYFGYDFGIPKCVNAVGIYGYHTSGTENIKVQGYNGSDWVDVADLGTYTQSQSWQYFSFENNNSYSKWRFYCTKGTATSIAFYELQFYQKAVQTNIVHSCANDTIYYMDEGSPVIVATTNSDGDGVLDFSSLEDKEYTFYSSVAKDPSNLSNDYSKTIRITKSEFGGTTEMYLMPDTVKTLYWYGYLSSNCEAVTTANGWVATSLGVGLNPPTMNTNDVYTVKSGGNDLGGGIGAKDAITINANIKAITKTTTSQAYTVYLCTTNDGKNMKDSSFELIVDTSVGVRTLSPTIKTGIRPYFSARSGNGLYIYALWYE